MCSTPYVLHAYRGHFQKSSRSSRSQKLRQNEAFPAVKAETLLGRKGRVTRILLHTCFRLYGRRYFVTWPDCPKCGLSFPRLYLQEPVRRSSVRLSSRRFVLSSSICGRRCRNFPRFLRRTLRSYMSTCFFSSKMRSLARLKICLAIGV